MMMIIKDSNDGAVLTIPLDLSGCMVYFKHRLPTAEEIDSLNQYCLTQGDAPWNPSTFSNQMAEKLYQQVIDIENYNISLSSNAKSLPCQHNCQKLSFYDPSDSLINNIKGKSLRLVFYADTVLKTMMASSKLTQILTFVRLFLARLIIKYCHLICV
jgi:hypothetical protein